MRRKAKRPASQTVPRSKSPGIFSVRFLMLGMAALALLSIAAFSLQVMSSQGVVVEVSQGYGTYQNGVFRYTGDTLVPSPYSVDAAKIAVKNTENASRNATITLFYQGTIVALDQPLQNDSKYIWLVYNLAPLEEKTFFVIGRNLQVGVASTSLPEQPPGIDNKELVPGNESPGALPPAQTVGYVREEPQPSGPIATFYAAQSRMDLFSKSIIVVLAGLVILVVASGLSFFLGRKEQTEPPREPKIHIEDFYHNGQPAGGSRYSYSEDDYWKKK